MNIDWQNLAVSCMVVAAAVYVVRRLLRMGRNRRLSSCGTCGQCPAATGAKQLVSLDLPKNGAVEEKGRGTRD